MNQILYPLLKNHEGLRLKAYQCSKGHWTIGWGHNIYGNRSSLTALMLKLDKHSVITEIEAEQIFKEDVALVLFELRPFLWFYDLTITRQCAIVDMLFNLGLGKFIGFKKFIAAMEVEDYDAASREMLDSLWATQVKRRAKTLSNMIKAGNS